MLFIRVAPIQMLYHLHFPSSPSSRILVINDPFSDETRHLLRSQSKLKAHILPIVGCIFIQNYSPSNMYVYLDIESPIIFIRYDPIIVIQNIVYIYIYTYIPIGSMYGMYIYIDAKNWDILMVNVTIYSIHGSYGYRTSTTNPGLAHHGAGI